MPSLAEIALMHGARRGDHERRLAEIQANARLQNANVWSAAIGGLADVGSAVAQHYSPAAQLARREAEQRVEANDLTLQTARDQRATAQQMQQAKQLLNDMLRSAKRTDPETGLITYDRAKLQAQLTDLGIADQWTIAEPLLTATDAAIATAKKAQQQALVDVATMVQATGNDPTIFTHELHRLVENGVVSEQRALPYLQALSQSPQAIERITAELTGKKPERQIVPAGASVVGSDGKPIFTAPTKAAEPPAVGTFEDYVMRRFGPNPTAQQISQARSQWAAMGRDNTPTPPQVGSFEDYVVQKHGPRPTPQQIADARSEWAQMAPTADQRNRAAGQQNTGVIIDSIDELSKRINTLQGVVAKASGAAEKAKAELNLNDDVSEYQALVQGFTPLLARAVGHTGVLTEQDVQSVRAMLPQPGDSQSVRDRKIARIRTIMAGMQAAAPVMGSDPASSAPPRTAITSLPTTPPPDQSGAWRWDGSRWVRR